MILPDDTVEPAIAFQDRFFDLKGLAKYSSLAVPTLRDHIRAGRLSCFKIKEKILVKRSEFDLWIEKHRCRAGQDIQAITGDIFRWLSTKRSDKASEGHAS